MKKIIHSLSIFLALALGFLSCSPATTSEENVLETNNQIGGLALYTLRDSMAINPKATLKVVADAGYAYVESADYAEGKFYGMTPAEFKSTLDSLGLTAISAHMGMVTLENADQLIADVKAAGISYFVIPVPPMGMFTFDPATQMLGMNGTADELVSIMNAIGEKCHQAGLKLLYHNHDFEFKPLADGTVIEEVLLEKCNPEWVNFQMDLYWVTKAEANALTYFEKYPGRFKAWHVKDMDQEGKFAPVGTGTIDFKSILAQKEKSGMEFYLVEQDQTFGLDPMEAIKISHKGLIDLGFD
ncbi:MAG: sugar phosphate isomerase/epimerase [Algoriphagus sp.]|jgi:sugar phosphate isomerase/epimerase|uniref:sugar phosphate isomerase/epimerase family protein n=3 Tax=Algoriphagus sp. TaxID=1872435 RepID=UPI00275F589F|nr:sugar phosphate isomerase/epimerase [Algoriphagus sp.]MDP4839517.1 sugar phosphate isomerase/epimerase [Algoriphagus sp.]MDP4903728.1 sugar phosphate isomerase/epimerase [Algoriphagus sp.]